MADRFKLGHGFEDDLIDDQQGIVVGEQMIDQNASESWQTIKRRDASNLPFEISSSRLLLAPLFAI